MDSTSNDELIKKMKAALLSADGSAKTMAPGKADYPLGVVPGSTSSNQKAAT